LQVQSPEFKPLSHQKERKEKRKIVHWRSLSQVISQGSEGQKETFPKLSFGIWIRGKV
jgi:hypothetical protein